MHFRETFPQKIFRKGHQEKVRDGDLLDSKAAPCTTIMI